MALGDHLRPNQNLGFPIAKLLQDLFHATTARDRIPIESVDTGFGEERGEGFLDPLGSRRTLAQAGELTLWATVRDSPLLCTVVALGDIPVLVIGQGNVAAVAAE